MTFDSDSKSITSFFSQYQMIIEKLNFLIYKLLCTKKSSTSHRKTMGPRKLEHFNRPLHGHSITLTVQTKGRDLPYRIAGLWVRASQPTLEINTLHAHVRSSPAAAAPALFHSRSPRYSRVAASQSSRGRRQGEEKC